MMKKLAFITAALFYVVQLSALPFGNPSTASLFLSQPVQAVDCEACCPCYEGLHLRIGYYGDFVFNRHLKTIGHKHIDYSKITTHAGYLALNCWELFEIFTTLGASKFSLNTSLVAFNPANRSPRFDFTTATDFSWSIGAHATIWQYKCLNLGVMGQYFTSQPRTDIWFIRANISARPNNDTSRYSEWQAGAGISYRYRTYFVPYVALKWSRALWEFNNQPLFLSSGGASVATLVNLKSSKHVGWAVGLSFAPFECQNLAVTVEGRFGDEKAAHVNCQLFF